MAGFDLNDVLGAVLGGNNPSAARRNTRSRSAAPASRGRSQNAALGRALTVLVGAAAEAISKMGQNAPAPQQPTPMPVPRPAPAKGRDVPAATPAGKPGPWWSGPAAPVPQQAPPQKPGWGGSVPATGAPPSGAWSTPAPPPPSAPSAEHAEALLLIRTMIAAAKADGAIDAEERAGIARQLDGAGLTAAERDFVLADFGKPLSPEALAAEARDPMLAAQLYAAAFAATRAISEGERAWLDAFARALRLDRAAVAAIEQRLGGHQPG